LSLFKSSAESTPLFKPTDSKSTSSPLSAATPAPSAAKEKLSSSSPKRQTDFTDLPSSNMRQVIAKRLTESKYATPHSHIVKEFFIDKLIEVRKTANSDGNFKFSLNDFIIKAVAITLKRVPEVNVLWNQKTSEADIQQTVDVSVAVAIEGGLITPIIFGADKKGIKEINENVKALAEKARKGTLQPKEFQGGTFTISNLGMFGITQFTSVINSPQAAILSVGGSKNKMVIDETTDKFSAQTVMAVTLNFDARAIDSDIASKFLDALAECLQQPTHLVL